MKYRVKCGAFASVIRKRTFIVSADNEEEAAEKADKMMWGVSNKAFWNISEVTIDSVEEVKDQ